MPLRASRLVLSVLLAAGAAAADVPPPPGFVETCSVDKQQRPGEECVSCSTYFAEADACQKKHAPRGYAQRCRTRGASTWSEIWCKTSSGVEVSSTSEPRDAAGGPDAGDPIPTGSAPPVTTAAPGPSAVTADGQHGATPSARANADGPPAPTPVPERGGSCGACRVGAAESGSALPAVAALLASLGAGARRRLRAGSLRAGTGR